MAKSVRTTITVPSDLKARMEAVEEAVNWSAVAARAFEFELARIVQTRGVKSMSDVVNRLRATRVESVDKARDEGFKEGQRWAKHEATVDQLERLESFVEQQGESGGFDERWFELSFMAPHTGAGLIAGAVLELEDAHDQNAMATGLFDERDDEPAYVVGVVEGALDVWREVKDQI